MKRNTGAVIAISAAAMALPILLTTSTASAQGLSSRRATLSRPARGDRDTRPAVRDVRPAAPKPSLSDRRPSVPGSLQQRGNPPTTPRLDRPGNLLSRPRPSLPERGNGGVTLPPKGTLSPGSVTLRPGERSRVNLPPKPNPARDGSMRPSLPERLPRHPDREPVKGIIVDGPTYYVSDWGLTVFSGYGTYYIPNHTYLSPFHMYNCPPYVRSSYIVTSPYLYGGRETRAFQPYADDDYYYSANVYRGKQLRATLNDLSRFWEENDARALRRHVSPEFAIGVFQAEEYAYSLRRDDFLAMSADAIDRIQTVAFRFTNVRERSDGLVNAYATHTYRLRGDGATRSATVRYTLVFLDNDWYVSAISHAPDVAGGY